MYGPSLAEKKMYGEYDKYFTWCLDLFIMQDLNPVISSNIVK